MAGRHGWRQQSFDPPAYGCEYCGLLFWRELDEAPSGPCSKAPEFGGYRDNLAEGYYYAYSFTLRAWRLTYWNGVAFLLMGLVTRFPRNHEDFVLIRPAYLIEAPPKTHPLPNHKCGATEEDDACYCGC